MLKLLLIFPWIGALIAAWWYTETNGSRLKKYDAALYEKIKNDKEGKVAEEEKKKLEEIEKLLKASKDKLADYEKIAENDLSEEDKTAMKELKEKIIPEQKSKVEALQCVGGKLWMPILSLTNIAWFVGILIVAGGVGHYITKKVLSMFSDKEN